MDWKYLQTPQFTLSNATYERHDPLIELTVRHGIITGSSVTREGGVDVSTTSIDDLKGQKLHDIESWGSALETTLAAFDSREKASVVNWLEWMLPAP
jgi:hypothetical protein